MKQGNAGDTTEKRAASYPTPTDTLTRRWYPWYIAAPPQRGKYRLAPLEFSPTERPANASPTDGKLFANGSLPSVRATSNEASNASLTFLHDEGDAARRHSRHKTPPSRLLDVVPAPGEMPAPALTEPGAARRGKQWVSLPPITTPRTHQSNTPASMSMVTFSEAASQTEKQAASTTTPILISPVEKGLLARKRKKSVSISPSERDLWNATWVSDPFSPMLKSPSERDLLDLVLPTQSVGGRSLSSVAPEFSLCDVYRSCCVRLGLKKPNAVVVAQLPSGTACGDEVNAMVEFLDFSHTYLGPRGCLAAAAVFPSCPNLQGLSFRATGLSSALPSGAVGGEEVPGDTAATRKRLRSEEVRGVFGLLKTCPQLRSLDLADNGVLDDACGQALLSLVIARPTMRLLDLSGTYLADPIRSKIQRHMSSRGGVCISSSTRRHLSHQGRDMAETGAVDAGPLPEDRRQSDTLGSFPSRRRADMVSKVETHRSGNVSTIASPLQESQVAAGNGSRGDEVPDDPAAEDHGSDSTVRYRRVPAFVAAGLVELRMRLLRNRHCVQRVYDCFVLPESVERKVSLASTAIPYHPAADPMTREQARSFIHLELLGAPMNEETLERVQQGTCSWKAFFRGLRVLGIHSVSKNLAQAIAFASVCGVLCAETVQFGKLLNMLRPHAVLAFPLDSSRTKQNDGHGKQFQLERGKDILAAYRRQMRTEEVYDSSPFYSKLRRGSAPVPSRASRVAVDGEDPHDNAESEFLMELPNAFAAPSSDRYRLRSAGAASVLTTEDSARTPPEVGLHLSPPLTAVSVDVDRETRPRTTSALAPRVASAVRLLPEPTPHNSVSARTSRLLSARPRIGSVSATTLYGGTWGAASVSFSAIPSMLVSQADVEETVMAARRASLRDSTFVGHESTRRSILGRKASDDEKRDADTVQRSRPSTSVAPPKMEPQPDSSRREITAGLPSPRALESARSTSSVRGAYFKSLGDFEQPAFSYLSGEPAHGPGGMLPMEEEDPTSSRRSQHRRSVTWREMELNMVMESDGLFAPVSDAEVQFALDRLFDARHALRKCLAAVAEVRDGPDIDLARVSEQTQGQSSPSPLRDPGTLTEERRATSPPGLAVGFHAVPAGPGEAAFSPSALPLDVVPRHSVSSHDDTATTDSRSRASSQCTSSVAPSPQKGHSRVGTAQPVRDQQVVPDAIASSWDGPRGEYVDSGYGNSTTSAEEVSSFPDQGNGVHASVCQWPVVEVETEHQDDAALARDSHDDPLSAAVGEGHQTGRSGETTTVPVEGAFTSVDTDSDNVVASTPENIALEDYAGKPSHLAGEQLQWGTPESTPPFTSNRPDARAPRLVPLQCLYDYCVALVGAARQGVLQCVFHRCGLNYSDPDTLVDYEEALLSRLKLPHHVGGEKSALPVLPFPSSPMDTPLRCASRPQDEPPANGSGERAETFEERIEERNRLLAAAADRPLVAEEATTVWHALSVRELQTLTAPF